MLQCRTLRHSTWLPVRRDLNFEVVRPALEKHRSDEADVAGMHKYFAANCFNIGNCPEFSLQLHQSSELVRTSKYASEFVCFCSAFAPY